MGIITGAGIMSILMMTSGFLLATRSFLVSSCSRFDLEHETREEEERSMIHQSVLNLPPPQHKVYPNNLFEDKEVGASLRKQQHEKLNGRAGGLGIRFTPCCYIRSGLGNYSRIYLPR